MAKLDKNKAFSQNEIRQLMNIGKLTLETARSVSEDTEKCLADISVQLNRVPAAAKEGGTGSAVTSLKNKIRQGKYEQEKKRLSGALKKLEEAVPKYDRQCAGQLKRLASACDRIYTRITDLDRFLQKGTANLPGDQFLEELTACQKVWEEEGEKLSQLLASVKAGLKGLEVSSCQYSSDPVNLSTGNFIYDKTDLRIKGEPGLCFRRFYNALEERKGVMGTGWIHNYEVHIKEGEEWVSLYLEDGKEEHYEEGEEGIFKSLRGSLGCLKREGEGFRYEKADGDIYRFDKDGKCILLEDVRGNGTELSYDGEGRLVCARERGEGEASSSLSYAYDGDGQLIRVSDHTGRTVRMSYEKEKLVHVEALEGTCYDYRYDEEGRLAVVTNAAGIVTVKNTYDRDGRTKRQVFPDGSRMKYRYLEEEGQVELTERNGARTIYCHDSLYRNTKIIYEDGEESFTYDRNNRRTSHTDKNGNRTVYGWDARGHLAKVVDALGNRTTMTYNEKGRLLKVSVNGKEKVRNHYDGAGNLIKTTDGEGNCTEFTYDEKKRPIHILQADGGETSITYDEKGNILKIRNAAGLETCYAYDALNRVVKSTDGNGNATLYSYNEKDELVRVTNAEGKTRSYFYNHGKKATKIVDYDGSITETAYNCLNRPEAVTDAEGNRTEYTYDCMWNISCVRDAAGGETKYFYDRNNRLEAVEDAEGRCVCFSYDACGNRTETEGKGGEKTQFSYDALNRMVKMTEPDGTVTEISYNEVGNVTEVKDSIGNMRKIMYNEVGRKTVETDGSGRTVRYGYDAVGNLISVTDAAGRRTEYHYEKGGLLKQTTYPDGTWERYSHDGCGNVTKKERADGYSIFYAYDCLNRLIKMESSTGQGKYWEYDAVGNVTAVTDASGNRTAYRYDRTGKLTGVTDAEGGEARYCYDGNGMLAELMQFSPDDAGEGQHITRYTRDRLGQVTAITDAMGRTEHFVYDASGRLESRTDRDGFTTSYAYTVSGQTARITYGDGKQAEFVYNDLRRLSEVKDWLGTMSFAYDGEGRIIRATDYRGKEVQYRYGESGEREAVIYPDGKEVIYGYDGLLRLASVESGSQRAEYAYDAYGRLSSRRTSDGILTEYGYDAAGLTASLVHTGADGILESYRYGYDAAGNRIREERYRKDLEEETGTYTYGYDRLHRLIRTAKDGEVLRSCRYDSFGNRTDRLEGEKHTRYTYNALNQLVYDTDGTAEHHYEYDGRGNLIRTLENGNLAHAYAFGAMNRMNRAVDSMGNVAEYLYNGLGHRTGMREGKAEPAGSGGVADFKENGFLPDRPDAGRGQDPGVDGLLPDISETWNKETEYILDFTKGYHNLLQREEDGNVQSYVWDSGALFMEENGESYRYLNDMQGSTMRLLNHGGEDMISYQYDEFGTDLSGNQGKFQPFGYTGYQRDAVAGTYYAQAREYDAGSGRFTSEDVVKGSAADPETLNAYGYCWGNPVKYVDRDGAFPTFSDVKKKAEDFVDKVDEAVSEAIEWSHKIWEQEIVGEDTIHYETKVGNDVTYEVSTHKGGNIVVIKRDEAGNFKGWSVNAKVKFGDTGVSASAKLSGKGLNPKTWKYTESVKRSDKETGISYGVGRYTDAKGTGYSVSMGGTSGNMPLPLPDGTQIDDYGSLNWSLSYNKENVNWNDMLGAAATAVSIAGAMALLIWLVSNDASGVGVLDDAAIPGVIAALAELFAKFGQYLPQFANGLTCGLE